MGASTKRKRGWPAEVVKKKTDNEGFLENYETKLKIRRDSIPMTIGDNDLVEDYGRSELHVCEITSSSYLLCLAASSRVPTGSLTDALQKGAKEREVENAEGSLEAALEAQLTNQQRSYHRMPSSYKESMQSRVQECIFNSTPPNHLRLYRLSRRCIEDISSRQQE